MIKADLHLHTCYSHGQNTPFEMHMAAQRAGLELMGFTEHSPRPLGYNYNHEYREQLTAYLPRYLSEVKKLKTMAQKCSGACQVLLGLEMDWLHGEEDFIRRAIAYGNYDYVIGSVHFIGKWGFDDGQGPWLNATQEECEKRYVLYFEAWLEMINSGFFNIAAHPDLIKIFSVGEFHTWLQKNEARSIIRSCLASLRNAGMAMEISSAGLRKACKEIYPCPEIMALAAELDVPVSFASDAHCMADVGYGFDQLASYAKNFGFESYNIFANGKMTTVSF